MKIHKLTPSMRAVLVSGVRVEFDENGVAEVDEATGAKMVQLGYRVVEESRGRAHTIPKPEPKVETKTEQTNLQDMNATQLKKMAKDLGIEIGDATKKAELIQLIEKARN